MRKIFLLLGVVSCCILNSGCFLKPLHLVGDHMIADGDFEYFYVESEDCYAALGQTDDGKANENVYIPLFYNGKVVKYTAFGEQHIASTITYALEAYDYQNVYFNYLHESRQGSGVLEVGVNYAKNLFFINCDEQYISRLIDFREFFYSHDTTFVNEIAFTTNKEKIINQKEHINGMFIYRDLLEFDELLTNDYQVVALNNQEEIVWVCQIANTSYMFNYEDSPNEGYFFINDFEMGGHIENTPYEPTREGYTFTGWYKEAECIEKWDFEKDTLPVADYDDEGNLKFVETRLYAGWIKN